MHLDDGLRHNDLSCASDTAYTKNCVDAFTEEAAIVHQRAAKMYADPYMKRLERAEAIESVDSALHRDRAAYSTVDVTKGGDQTITGVRAFSAAVLTQARTQNAIVVLDDQPPVLIVGTIQKVRKLLEISNQ